MTTTQTNDTSNSNESLSDKNDPTSQGVGETPKADADLWLASLLFPAMYGRGML